MAGEQALPAAQTRPELRVLAYALARHQHAYVADGLRHRGIYRSVGTEDDLLGALALGEGCDVIVIGPRDANGCSTAPLVERIARDWSGVGVVMFFPPRPAPDFSPRSFLLAGAH